MIVAMLELLRCLDPILYRAARLSSVWVVLGLFLLVPGAEAADVAAFLADYRAALQLQTARRTSLEVEGSWVSVLRGSPQDAAPNRREIEFIYTRNPTHEKLQSRHTEKPSLGEVSVIVQGEKRNFWLKAPAPGSAFAITMMEPPTAASQDPINRQRRFAIEAWSNLGTYSVAKLLDSPGFRVERVEPEGDLIGIDFSFQPEDARKLLMAGHFAVDPAQGMAIRRQDIRRWASATPDNVGTIHGEATYRMVDAIAFPDEVILRIGRPNQPPSDDIHFHAARVSAAAVPNSAFSLAAFGLGDVDRPALRSRFDFTYWAVGLAGVAFALSVVLKWRGRNLARAGDRPVGVAG